MALRPLLLAAVSALLVACRAASPAPPAAVSAPTCPSGGSWSLSLAPDPLPEAWVTSLAGLPDGRLVIVGGGRASIDTEDALWDPTTRVFTRFAHNPLWMDAAPTMFPLPDGRILVFDDPGYASSALLTYHVLDTRTLAWYRVLDPRAPGGTHFLLTTAPDGSLRLAYGGLDNQAQLRPFEPAPGAVGPNLLPARGFERRVPVAASPDGVIFGGGGKPDEARLGHPFESLLPPRRGFPNEGLVLVDPMTGRARATAVPTGDDLIVPGPTATEAFLFDLTQPTARRLRRVDVRAGRTRELPAPTVDDLPLNIGAIVRLANGALLAVSGSDPYRPTWARCFDPASERWSVLPAPPRLPRGRGARLADGRVAFLIAPDEGLSRATGVMMFTP